MQNEQPHPKQLSELKTQSMMIPAQNGRSVPSRSSSAPTSALSTSSTPNSRPSSTTPAGAGHHRSGSQAGLLQAATQPSQPPPLDLCPQLLRSGPSVVKTRSGSVLSRGFILKTDHYPSGRALDLDLNVHGAPNFRSPRLGNLNVFGVAQPRTQGLRAILSVLRCHPSSKDPSHCVWFSTREEPIVYISGRPFVLRDSSEPRKTLSLSDRAEALEGIEQRLKQDILQESLKYGGLLLTHNEVATDNAEGVGAILPTWTAVDAANVKTSRELWETMRNEGWRLDYYRIPISPDRPIEDNYLDAYVRVIERTDPFKTSLVFSCGMGAVRTTFAMVSALIVRRKQVIARGYPDPFKITGPSSTSGLNTPSSLQVVQILEQANVQQELSKSLLRLTNVLQQSLPQRSSHTAVELLLSQPSLMENLRKAHMGNYSVILSLLGCLDHGIRAKKIVDRVIDCCDHVVNLREEILSNRIRYSFTALDEKRREYLLSKAARALEKYFFVIAFTNYVEEHDNFTETFSSWLKTRTELWNQVTFLRKSEGSRLNILAPVNDLSALSKTAESQGIGAGLENDVAIAGGQILGDEYSDHVVKNRRGIILREGTLLKSDQWLSESQEVQQSVRGAISFRNVPGTKIYALGQPTVAAIDEVVQRVKSDHPSADQMVWITLREEPIVYVNGSPYCLRRESFTLRNMKDYGGISAARLETLEERLKDDVISELHQFGGSLLLHEETADGTIVPVWEDVRSTDVEALKDLMSQRENSQDGLRVFYRRVPITAERPPDYSDLSELMDIVTRTHTSNTPIVLNCQLGRGRSTLTSIIVLLIQQWLQPDILRGPSQPVSPGIFLRTSFIIDMPDEIDHAKRHSYQIINNLLRVIRNGLVVKATVDQAIDRCGQLMNLRESIEDARVYAEQASNDLQRRQYAQKGFHNLRRYFELIIFQWYLQSTEPDIIRTVESIETFVKNRPVIKTFEKELYAEGIIALKPLEKVHLSDDVALPDEEKQVVANRTGSILSASTILKSDFFSNLQKMSLPERIDGSPNFRRVPLVLSMDQVAEANSSSGEGKWVCGSGMPTVQGLRRALARMNAHPEGSSMVFWTSLREEPVLYLAGRPHVLRLVDRPLENVEATGITTQVVETMENSLKADVIKEMAVSDGRILLHDEVEERPGVFSIIPQWETVTQADIMTPRDVFDLMSREGFKINYGRIAITDEQAPLPDALYQLYERVSAGLDFGKDVDFVFNCQMGRGRTTTGMVTACLIATTLTRDVVNEPLKVNETDIAEHFDSIDGPSEEDAYLQGEYKTILQLVGVLSYGRHAKRLTDSAIDMMQDVQNLRKAIYDYKLKLDALDPRTDKYRKLFSVAINYLYRYGALIVFADYLIEMRQGNHQQTTDRRATFPIWLSEHREITRILGRRTLE